jgi:hypothetical protein
MKMKTSSSLAFLSLTSLTPATRFMMHLSSQHRILFFNNCQGRNLDYVGVDLQELEGPCSLVANLTRPSPESNVERVQKFESYNEIFLSCIL